MATVAITTNSDGLPHEKIKYYQGSRVDSIISSVIDFLIKESFTFQQKTKPQSLFPHNRLQHCQCAFVITRNGSLQRN